MILYGSRKNFRRNEEKQKTEEKKPMNVFIDTTYVPLEYIESMSISDAYSYLKTTEKFKDAEDC